MLQPQGPSVHAVNDYQDAQANTEGVKFAQPKQYAQRQKSTPQAYTLKNVNINLNQNITDSTAEKKLRAQGGDQGNIKINDIFAREASPQ